MERDGREPVGELVGAGSHDPKGAPEDAETAAVRFARAMLDGNARAAAACFSPAGAILTADGTAVSGRDRVAQVLAQITGGAQMLQIGVGQTVICDGVALCTQFWRRSSDGPGGSSYRSSSTARLVLRRGRRWEIVIASPWG